MFKQSLSGTQRCVRPFGMLNTNNISMLRHRFQFVCLSWGPFLHNLDDCFKIPESTGVHGSRTIWNERLNKQQAAKAESFYDSTVEKYATKELEILTLKEMLSFGRSAWSDPEKVLRSARYAQKELPKRLARRLLDLQLLPYIVVTNPHIKKVYNAYYNAFEILRTLPPIETMEDNAEFSVLLRRLVDEHAPMLDALARGLRECSSKEIVGKQLALNDFLDSMLRSRISRRVIAEQHLHISHHRPGYIGIICTDLDLVDSMEFAAQRTTQVSMETYGIAPDVKTSGDVHEVLPYIPTHLDYMLYELLKNACRATLEFHRHKNLTTYPPIQVRICSSPSAVTIRVSDQGGGIPESMQEDVWGYGFSTVSDHVRGDDECDSDMSTDTGSMVNMLNSASLVRQSQDKMAGLGFGLPLSRLYAKYFGGDLKLQSIPGYGVDAYLTLKRLEEYEWQEMVEEQPNNIRILPPR